MKFILTVAAIVCAQAATAAPNILLVIADDMGVDASPCHPEGMSDVRMPVLAQLCKTGMVFDNTYAAPLCSPTRAAIMTGRYGSRTGVGGVVSKSNPATLSDSEFTLFDGMKTAGYATALIGKWHLSAKRSDLSHPKRLGVEYHFGPTSGGTKDYFNWAGAEQGSRVTVDGYITSDLTDKAIAWTRQQDKPWFLWLAYTAPHTPFHAPPQDLHSFGNLTTNSKTIRRDPRKHYFAALEALDTELGRLLAGMDRAERANTVVAFIGDNGTPGQLTRRSGTTGRSKGSLHDGGTRVPLIVGGPGVVQGRSNALVNATDLFATLLAFAGQPSRAEDSISLKPVLAGVGQTTRKFAYVELFSRENPRRGARPGWAIRDARYKLVQKEAAAAELYDMERDGGEQRNLLASGSAKAVAIAKRLEAGRAELLR